MHIDSIPQLVALIALIAASFGWGVTMNKKQDKAACAENNAELYRLIRDMTESINEMKIELGKMTERLSALERRTHVRN